MNGVRCSKCGLVFKNKVITYMAGQPRCQACLIGLCLPIIKEVEDDAEDLWNRE